MPGRSSRLLTIFSEAIPCGHKRDAYSGADIEMNTLKHSPPWFTTAVLAVLLCMPPTVRADGVSLDDLQSILLIDKESISVSGISSGAYMAQQFHVIHSSRIMGAGIIAGGPYNCSGGFYYLSLFDPTGLYAALNVCSATNLLGLFTGPPEVEQSINSTLEEAKAQKIDDPANLAKARVWLFSGENDATVPRAVVASVEQYYLAFLSPDRIRFETLPGANHAMITDDFGSSCELSEPPYINNCGFDAAEALLQHIYGPPPLAPGVKKANNRFIVEFDQTRFFDPRDKSVSMHDRGHIYVPSQCARGRRCRLHIAFHGCGQQQDEIDDVFYTRAGYNEMAEANGIVVLYPQTQVWSESIIFQYTQNPKGCWDWWGYSGEDFLRKSGKQIQAVAKMVNTLLGENFLPLK